MTQLRVDSLSVTAAQTRLVDSATFEINSGELVVMLGPNGSGKTTLLRAALGLQKASSGAAYIDNEDVQTLSAHSRARRIAYLPQTRPLAWPSRVEDIVALGRFSHGANISSLKGVDLECVTRALEACDIMHLKDRHADTLSGGELARMHCARAFAARAPLLIADEPVAALDPRHQFRVMDLIKAFVKGGGGALVVLHDISLAAKYADRLIWMKNAAIIADGPPKDTLTQDRLAQVYGVRATIESGSIRIHDALK